MDFHRTLTGRVVDLRGLTQEEKSALTQVQSIFAERPSWTEFARRWQAILGSASGDRVPVGTPLYLYCQDLEFRLGIAEGRVAPPDYRDRLADLIDERFGTRNAFCKAAGIDQGNLSHVLAGRKHLSLETLQKVLDTLRVQLELVPRDEAMKKAMHLSDRTERLRQLEYRISAIEDLAARADAYPDDQRPDAVPASDGLFPDEFDGLRARLQNGRTFDQAVSQELAKALDEQVALARQIADSAASRRDLHTKAVG